MTKNKFQIKNIQIEHYHSQEYPRFSISDLDGKSLFVSGTNNSGKTTTLDAIIYSIFGYNFVERPASDDDSSQIILWDGEREIEISRKYNKSDEIIILDSEGSPEEIEGSQAVFDKLVDELGLPEELRKIRAILKCLILPQQTEDAPLRSFTENELKSMILTFSSGVEISKRVEEIEDAIEDIQEEIERLIYRRNNIQEEIDNSRIVINRNKNRVNDLREFIFLYESGELSRIRDLLTERESLQEELDGLYSERTGKYDSLFKTRRKISDLKRYHGKKLVESTKETLSVLTCPVCGDNEIVTKVEGRKRNNYCPFCGKDDYSGGLYETIESKIKSADTDIDDLREEEEQIEERIEEIDEKIDEIKTRDERLENVNAVAVKAIQNLESEKELKDRYQRLKEEYEELDGKIREEKSDIDTNKSALGEVESAIEEREGKIRKLEENEDQIERKVSEENIERFNRKLDSIYKDLIHPLDHMLYYEDGKILLDNGRAIKDCTDKHTLGYSQRRIVDVALWLTFNELNLEDEITRINFTLFDDIYENIDNNQVKWKDNLIESLKSLTDNIQLITCSIDQDLNSKLECEVTEILQYQTDLEEFEVSS